MVGWLLLAATLIPCHSPNWHVRTTEARIRALLDEGRARSETFRHLLATLDASDVIVYVEAKLTRPALGGFLFNRIVARDHWRYIRVAVNHQGSHPRLIALLAHELQHAVEVAQQVEVRDALSLERMFSRVSVAHGCAGASCYETQAAQDIEWRVLRELKTAHPVLEVYR
jgi:hypothetical protein